MDIIRSTFCKLDWTPSSLTSTKKLNRLLIGTIRLGEVRSKRALHKTRCCRYQLDQLSKCMIRTHVFHLQLVPFSNVTSWRLNRCWWRMLETINVGDNFGILVIDWNSHQHNDSATNILKLSPWSNHQYNVATDLTNFSVMKNTYMVHFDTDGTKTIKMKYITSLTKIFLKCYDQWFPYNQEPDRNKSVTILSDYFA